MRENPGALGFFGEVGPVGGASRRTDAIVRIAFATGRRFGSSLALARETAMGGCVFFFSYGWAAPPPPAVRSCAVAAVADLRYIIWK